MSDVWHQYGGDLQWSASGDLRAVDGSDRGRQRVLRRLLTAEGGDIWAPEYGAGIPQLVGEPNGAELAQNRARVQMLLEPAVARDPFPQVSATGNAAGLTILSIQYTDADTATPVSAGITIQGD